MVPPADRDEFIRPGLEAGALGANEYERGLIAAGNARAYRRCSDLGTNAARIAKCDGDPQGITSA